MSTPFADEAIARFVAGSTLGDLDVAAIRAGIAARAADRTPGPSITAVHDVVAGERSARVYRPFDAPSGPVIVWLHAGGWCVGSVESHDRACRRLAATSGVAVVSVDYRLAPEDPWPASVDDAVAALRWVMSAPSTLGFTPSAVGIGGDSAGGTLAALATLSLRDDGEPVPSLTVLAYANTDLVGDHPSMREKAVGFGLDAEMTRFFNRQWVPEESRWSDPGVSPLYADPSGLPTTLVVTCEHDILRDEGTAYADRLRAAGVDVENRCEPGMIHNFLMLDELSSAAAAAGDRLAADIGRLLTG